MKPSLKPLGDQVMVVTGASSGICLLIAATAAKCGTMLFLIARNGDALARIVHDIGAQGGIADFAVADVGDPKAIDAAADQATERFGRIDCWLNNTVVAIYAPL